MSAAERISLRSTLFKEEPPGSIFSEVKSDSHQTSSASRQTPADKDSIHTALPFFSHYGHRTRK
jgi:hypothetical protein